MVYPGVKRRARAELVEMVCRWWSLASRWRWGGVSALRRVLGFSRAARGGSRGYGQGAVW